MKCIRKRNRSERREGRIPRVHGVLSALMALLLAALSLSGLTACSQQSEIPAGYQYATCNGEYFRLFVPTQWTVNTESGVSSAYISLSTESMVSMAEIPFSLESGKHNGDSDGHGGSDRDDRTDRTATLSDFVDAHVADVSTLRDYTQEKLLDTTLNGKKAKDMTYTASIAGKVYRIRQVLTAREGRFYLFTYSSLADSFDMWLDEVDKMLENITFYNFPYEGNDTRALQEDEHAPAGMKRVSTDAVAYRFYVPSSWIVSLEAGCDLAYVSETDRTNVSMMAYMPEDEGYSVADYWSLCQTHYKDALENFTVLSETTDATMGERRATVVEYSYTVDGVTYRTRQVMAVWSTMVYVMTYTALPEQYAVHLEEAQQIQASLTFRSWGK